MHDRARRLICRLAFVAGCIVPTFAVLVWAGSYHLPGSTRRLEAELSSHLGLRVEIDDVAYPRPGVMRIAGLALADREFGRPVLRIDSLEATFGDALTLVAENAEAEPAAIAELWRLLREELHSAEGRPLLVSVRQAHCSLGEKGARSKEVYTVRARIEPGDGRTSAVLAVGPPGAGEEKFARLDLLRERQASPATLAWELKTGAQPLPCSLATAVLPGLVRLGRDSRFRGTITTHHAGGHWACELAGELTQVDLRAAAQGWLAHEVDGVGRIEIEQAQLRDGRLAGASATLTAGPGRMSRSLLIAATEALGMEPAAAQERLQETEMFQQLGIAVGMNSRGVLLRGIAEGEPGAAVVAPWGVVLRTREPQHPLLPIAALVQLAAAEPTSTMPATLEAHALSSVLPLEKGE